MPHFGRVLSAMITPFDADGELDLDVAVELARHLQSNGHDGLVLAGTTGEAPTLSDDERLALFDAVIRRREHPRRRRHRHQRHPPLGAPHPRGEGARRGRRPRRVPVLQPAVAGRHRRPHAGDRRGERPARDGVRHPGAHRPQDVDAARCCSSRHDVPNIVALKDAAGNPGETAALISSAPRGFEVYSGDDGHDAARCSPAASSAPSAWPRTGPPTTTSSCSTSGRRATSSAPGWSTAGCSRASPSRPATTPQPHPHEGDDATSRICGGPSPPPHGRRPGVRRPTGARGAGRTCNVGATPSPSVPDGTARPHRLPRRSR